MKVRDVMTREITSVSPEMSARDALHLLQKMQISGLPVIDDNGKLLGMFTEKDILSHILPSYLEKVGRFIYEDNPKAIKKKFSELSNKMVKQLMRKDVLTVAEDTALCEVAKIMLTQKVRRIPVLDKSAKVVGIVARNDILRGMLEESQKV